MPEYEEITLEEFEARLTAALAPNGKLLRYEIITLEEFKTLCHATAAPSGRMLRADFDTLINAAGTNMFEYNRFNKEIMLEELKNITLDIDRGVVDLPRTRDFLLYDQWPDEDSEMEIHFADRTEKSQRRSKEYYHAVIAEALTHLPDFDNQIQRELQDSYVSSKAKVAHFLYSPYWMRVIEGDVLVAYGGCEVNNEFHAFFIKKDGEWVRDFSRRWE